MSIHEKLHAYYLLHRRVRGMESRFESAQRRHRALSGKLSQLDQLDRELSTQIRQAEARANSLENEADALEQRMTSLRQQMNTVRTDKEYAALRDEIGHLKEQKSTLDDQALEHMQSVEDLRKRLAEVQTQREGQTRLVTGAETELEKHRAEVGAELDAAKAEFEAAGRELAPEVRVLFARLSEQHEGEPLAPVIENDRRRMDYTCGGCYMGIPVERVNTLFVNRDEITTCPSCGRILFLEKDLKESLGPSKS